MSKRSEQNSGMCCLALSCNLSVSPDRQEWASSRGRCHGPHPWFNLAGEEGVGEPHGRSQKAQWPDAETAQGPGADQVGWRGCGRQPHRKHTEPLVRCDKAEPAQLGLLRPPDETITGTTR